MSKKAQKAMPKARDDDVVTGRNGFGTMAREGNKGFLWESM
jgi:hypothetical protein